MRLNVETENKVMDRQLHPAEPKAKHILPPATIGILGGGQLGRMMANEARKMGYGIVTLDPTPNCPCGQLADDQVLAAFDSLEGAQELARKADVITYEFENIGPEVAKELEQYSYLPQGFQMLFTTQNRLREKQAIEAAGVKVAPYVKVNSYSDLLEGVNKFNYPCVLKTAEGGYDGKGQIVLRAPEDLTAAKEMLEKHAVDFILEDFVPYVKEISVIVARNARGESKTFPVAENIHRENILHLSIAPARVSQDCVRRAEQIALQLADNIQVIGLLAIEMFVLADESIYVNELAPRPHNSGHYTQQGCYTNQFEQHIRAVCNLPLGDAQLLTPTVMVNILGDHLAQVIERMPTLDSRMKIHLYGKEEAKTKRKMGHLNVSSPTVEEAIELINQLEIWEPVK